MQTRSTLLCSFLCALFLATTGVGGEEPALEEAGIASSLSQPVANDPVVLSRPASYEVVDPRAESPDEMMMEAPSAGASSPVNVTNDRGLAQAEAVEQEGRALGSPNGLLDARPIEASSGEEVSFWSRLNSKSSELLRVGGALAAVLALLFVARGLIRRSAALAGGGRPSGVVEILARYPVGRSQVLILLKLGRRVVLLHQSGSTMTALSEVVDPEEVADLLGRMEAGAREKDAKRFRSLLKSFESEHRASTLREHAGVSRGGRGGDEIIDLTRRGSGRFGGLLGRRSSAA